MNTGTKTDNRQVMILIVGIIFLLFLAWNANLGTNKPDSDCIEWGVVKKDSLTENESWAPIHSTPKTREEAEQMAQELESQELIGRYHYSARCKKWRK